MVLYVHQVPDPPVGFDWVYQIPGKYLENIQAINATLVPGNGCSVTNPNTSMAGGNTANTINGCVSLPAAAFNPGTGPFGIEWWLQAQTPSTPPDALLFVANVAAVPGQETLTAQWQAAGGLLFDIGELPGTSFPVVTGDFLADGAWPAAASAAR